MQIIQSISTKELRDNLAEILERVAIGQQSFEVYKFGTIKAVINPPQIKTKEKKKKINFRELPAFGIWKDRKDMKDPVEWVNKIREKNSRHFSI
ncbi:MAG: hypothetical protein Q8P72_05660 [Candidatus Roizmanbacteria bacterium]|nr:hypothetical protein [Candidatus Roizmanbacteria bacterium]